MTDWAEKVLEKCWPSRARTDDDHQYIAPGILEALREARRKGILQGRRDGMRDAVKRNKASIAFLDIVRGKN